MRGRGGVAGLATWVLIGLSAPPAAPAATTPAAPIVIGPGRDASVAVDSAGTAHIAYNDLGTAMQAVRYCQIPQGAAACGAQQTIALAGSTTRRPFVFVEGQTVRILAYRYAMPTGPFAQDVLVTSADGGQTFSAPVFVGTLEADDAVAGPGAAISIVSAATSTSPSYQRVPTDGSAPATTAARLSTGHPYETAIGLRDGTTPIAAFTDGAAETRANYSQYSSGDPNADDSWMGNSLSSGSAPRIAGGPVGLFVSLSVPDGSGGSQRLTIFDQEENGFFPRNGTPISQPQPGPLRNTALVQDGAGVIQALFAAGDNAGHLFHTASGEYPTFTEPSEIVADSGFDGLRAAAGFDHHGVAVWNTGTGDGSAIHATRFASDFKSALSTPFDLRAKGLEVTQGVQTQEEGFLGGELPSLYPKPPEGELAKRLFGNVRYRGVKLAAASRTVVRFFADAAATGTGPPPQARRVIGVLRGFRGGKELPGSPLLAENGPLTLTDGGCPCVTKEERRDPAASYDFALPLEWAAAGDQRLTLRGELRQQSNILTKFANARFGRTSARPRLECATCAANNSLTLTDIPFIPTPTVLVAPVRMLVKGQADLPEPASVLRAALNLHPGGERFVIAPYQGTLDVTDEAKYTEASAECKDYVDRGAFDDCRNDAYFSRMLRWDREQGGLSDMAIGINAQERGAAANSLYNLPIGNPDTTANPKEANARPVATVNVGRPLTSVAHELGHLLGRGHASAACGGGGEDWPPDQRGVSDGIGLDRSRRAKAPGSPYLVIGSSLDVMSYCATESSAWIAERTWQAEIGTLNRFGNRVRFGVRKFPAAKIKVGAKVGRVAATVPRSLHVTAITDASGTRITDVGPAVAPVAAPAASDYELVVSDAGGAVIDRTPMLATGSHLEGGGGFIQLSADVPLTAAAASVSVVTGGAVVASRARSPHPPTVRVTAPAGGKRVGRSGVVRWEAADSDGDPLSASVAYSLDDGGRWRTIYSGPSTGQAVLPGAYFSASRRGRVLVRVNDGFDESGARSARFVARGVPPVVRLLSPASGTRVLNTSTLVLSGEAIDDAGQPVTGRRLRWFAGRRPLGRGASVSTADLAPGRRAVRLVATDRAGRRASAETTVTVIATKPELLALSGPKKVGRRARSVTLRLAVSARATLAVNGRSFGVGRKPRAVRVPIRRGSGVLRLRLVLRAGGMRSVVKVAMPR